MNNKTTADIFFSQAGGSISYVWHTLKNRGMTEDDILKITRNELLRVKGISSWRTKEFMFAVEVFNRGMFQIEKKKRFMCDTITTISPTEGVVCVTDEEIEGSVSAKTIAMFTFEIPSSCHDRKCDVYDDHVFSCVVSAGGDEGNLLKSSLLEMADFAERPDAEELIRNCCLAFRRASEYCDFMNRR